MVARQYNRASRTTRGTRIRSSAEGGKRQESTRIGPHF